MQLAGGLLRRAPPNIGILVDEDARGNFVPEIAAALKSEPAYMTRLGHDLLAAHFPSSLHEDICAAVGLEPDSISAELFVGSSARVTLSFGRE